MTFVDNPSDMAAGLSRFLYGWPTYACNGVNALGFAKPERDTRVVVAMSGGVDSSVVAGLLHVQGFDVIGVTLQLYDYGEAVQRQGACCAGQDIYDAKRVSEALGFPHYVLNYEDRFRQDVVEDFADSYLRGETPIPCVSCNQTVKFRDLFAVAQDLGGDCLVTGHYVSSSLLDSGHYGLFRPVDEARDQSYFLFATTQEQLDFLRFPLGRFTKAQTRDMAQALGLEIALKPDSQDICFVPNGHYSDVVKKLRPQALSHGDIVHLDGRVLGQHEGIVHFTIGQRRGLGIATGEPLFVVRLAPDTRQVIVGPREALIAQDVYLRSLNWLGDGSVESVLKIHKELPVFVKLRSTQPPQAAVLMCDEAGHFFVRLESGEEGVSPGQAAVLYEGSGIGTRVLGGGFISRTA